MAYTLMHESPQHKPAADVVVYYDNKEKRFLVTSSDKNTGGYAVSRQELIGDTFKYPDQIIKEIVYGIPDDDNQLVLVTNLARNVIALVSTENRLR